MKRPVRTAPQPSCTGPAAPVTTTRGRRHLDRFEKMSNEDLYDTRCELMGAALQKKLDLRDIRTGGLLDGEREPMLQCCRILEERLSRCTSASTGTASRTGSGQLSLPLGTGMTRGSGRQS